MTLDNGIISLCQLRTGLLINSFKRHLAQVTSGLFSFDGQTYISGSADGTIKIWHLQSNGKLKELLVHILSNQNSTVVISLTLSNDGKTLVAGCANGSIQIWKCDKIRQDLPKACY